MNYLEQPNAGFLLITRQLFSGRVSSLPIIGYGLDRLLSIFIFSLKIPFLNLHRHMGRHSNKYPSCTKPRPLAANFKDPNYDKA